MAESTDDVEHKKRSFVEMEGMNGEALLPNPKRQKLDTNSVHASDDREEITKEDMAFLFQLKQQNDNHSSLHAINPMNGTNGTTHSVNVTTDINHTSYFPAPSIASTNNSTTMDALSTTATVHTNPPTTFDTNTDHNKDPAAEKYYRQIVHRSSRVGESYQATFLPPLQSHDDAKYGGSPSGVDSPTSMGDKLRNERNEKRNNLDKNTTNDNEDEPATHHNIGTMIALNNMNFDDEEEEDDDDEDFNMDAYENNDSVTRVMEGIMGRRCDWLPGDKGAPFDDTTRTQYLVKWKDSAQPVWEYADELEQYQMKIDTFEDDEMEDVLCDMSETIAIDKDSNKDNGSSVHESEPGAVDKEQTDPCVNDK